MTNIEQFTRELMLAHDIDYKTALSRAEQFYDMLEDDRPEVLNGWISVEDRLPDEYEAIAILGYNYIGRRQCDHGCFYRNNDGEGIWVCGLQTITHWYLLPEPPKEK